MKLMLSWKYDLNGSYRNHLMERAKLNSLETLQNAPRHQLDF